MKLSEKKLELTIIKKLISEGKTYAEINKVFPNLKSMQIYRIRKSMGLTNTRNDKLENKIGELCLELENWKESSLTLSKYATEVPILINNLKFIKKSLRKQLLETLTFESYLQNQKTDSKPK